MIGKGLNKPFLCFWNFVQKRLDTFVQVHYNIIKSKTKILKLLERR